MTSNWKWDGWNPIFDEKVAQNERNMAKNRDEKGRFIPGVTPEGAKPFNEGTAKEMQSRSAEARKDNRIVADALRRALLGKDPDTGNPMIESIVKGAAERARKGGTFSDVRVAADILGELEQKIDHSGSIELVFKFGE